MSYIHDALRKAQREKDSGFRHYEPMLSPKRGGSQRGFFGFRAVLCALFAVLVFAFLSLLGYNLFTGGEKKDFHYGKVTVAPVGKPPAAATEEKPERAEPSPVLEQLYREALAWQQQGNIKGAERNYEKILAQDPTYVFALNNLGVIRLDQGERGKARSLFEEAIRIDEGYIDPLYNMACLHVRSGNRAEAIEVLRKARRLDGTILEWAERDADLAALCGSAEYKEAFYSHGEDKTQ